jgi:hypothetical protein
LGHAVLLAACESPFLSSGKFGSDELVFGIWICGHKFEDARKKLTEENIKLEFYHWGKQFGNFNFEEVSKEFLEYLEHHTRSPKTWNKANQKKCHAPWALSIATVLMKELGFPESEAWNMPLQQALWYFASVAESNGIEYLVPEEDQERFRLARERRLAHV